MGSASRKRKRKSSPGEVLQHPVRRSARLANIARPTSRSQAPPPRTSGPADSSTVPTVYPYSMELAVAPPQCIVAELQLQFPIIVTFMAPELNRSPQQQDEPFADLSGVWAYISLVTEDARTSLAPPSTTLLNGRTADSIHVIQGGQNNFEQPFAFAAFTKIVVNEPGKYRFRVNLVDMNNQLFEDASGGNVRVLPALHSQVFEVSSTSDHLPIDSKSEQALSRLQKLGVTFE